MELLFFQSIFNLFKIFLWGVEPCYSTLPRYQVRYAAEPEGDTALLEEYDAVVA